jgi:divinyl chlorophyllide a 8-vinyl-reductase
MNTLEAARAAGAKHFVLLSAICVQKPLLEFQRAKLKFEAALQVGMASAHTPLCICMLCQGRMHFQAPHRHTNAELRGMLQGAGDITYSIVRPTAFFKSLAGQVTDMLLTTYLLPNKVSSKCSMCTTNPKPDVSLDDLLPCRWSL